MKTIPTKLSELHCCPVCQSDRCYTKDWAEGAATTMRNFKFEVVDRFHDNVNYRRGTLVYCAVCGVCLGNITKDTVSVSLRNRLSKEAE